MEAIKKLAVGEENTMIAQVQLHNMRRTGTRRFIVLVPTFAAKLASASF